MAAKVAKIRTQQIAVDTLHEYPGNPNEQTATTFANLVDEISTDGFEEPLAVVPRNNVEPGLNGYTVVSGNHRLRCLKQLGYTAVDCVVHDWNAEQCKIKVMRRNMMRGDADPTKFTSLVDSLNGYTNDQLVDLMGFQDMDEFAQLYQASSFNHHSGGGMDKAENLVDGLLVIVNRLLSEYGDTIPYSFMVFLYGKKIHTMVQSDSETRKILNELAATCRTTGEDINGLFCKVMQEGMKAL